MISKEPGQAGQSCQLSAETELSLFLEVDDSMGANNRDEDNGDGDADMDHTVLIPCECSQDYLRAGPT